MKPLAHFLHKFGLQQQISAVVALGFVGIAVFTSVAASVQTSRQLSLQLRVQGQRIAENLAQGSSLALALQAPDNARAALDITLAFPDVLRAEIHDPSGAVLATRSRAGFSDMLSTRPPPKLAGAALLEAETDEAWRFLAPVQSLREESPLEATPAQGELLGYVRIVQSKATLARTMTEVFAFNLVLSLCFAAALVLLTRMLVARMTRPLQALSLVMGQARHGASGVHADEHSGSRDIATMAQAFNTMMAMLAEREQRFSSLASLSSDWYWERDEQDRLKYVSRGFEEITGIDPSPLIGSKRDERTGFTYGDSLAQCQAQVAARQPFRDLEWQLIDAHGEMLYGLISGEPIFDGLGVFRGYRGIGKNTTSAKLAEKAQLSAARLRKLVEHLPVGAVYIEHGTLTLNRAFQELSGFQPEDISNVESYFTRMYGSDAPAWRAGYEAERAEGFPRRLEGPLTRKDGARRYVEFSAYCDEHSEVWLLHDVTQRRKAEKALKQTLLEQQAVLDNASVAIAFTKNRTFQSCNREFDLMMRCTPGALIAAPTNIVYPSPEAFAELSALAIPILGSGGQLDTELIMMRQDGSQFWCRMRARAIDPVDQSKGTIFIMEDITERKQAEADLKASLAEQQATNRDLQLALQDLRQAQSQLVQSEKMAALGQVVAGVAHEINTPIGAVKSSGRNIADALELALASMPRLFQLLAPDEKALFMRLIEHRSVLNEVRSTREERAIVRRLAAELAIAGVAQPEQRAATLVQLNAHANYRDYLALLTSPHNGLVFDTAYSISTIASNTANINVAVERVAKIVFALKAFSRVDPSGEMVMSDVREGLETVLTIYQNQIKQNTELVRDYEDIPPVRCLPDELNQVWTNLIHNALQAMQQRGTLTLTIRRGSGEVIVGVGDSGSGIEPAIRERIFDAFFTTKPAGEGSGLGLDIVRKIIDKHGGRIELRSEVGAGTTFFVHLPISGEQS